MNLQRQRRCESLTLPWCACARVVLETLSA
jgi:hypothetical protein